MHYAAGYRSVMSTPGERLQTARKARGYETATDAANALGIPVATYTQHENGLRGFPAKRAPQFKTVAMPRIAGRSSWTWS